MNLKEVDGDQLGITGEGQDRDATFVTILICIDGWIVVPFSDEGLKEGQAYLGVRVTL